MYPSITPKDCRRFAPPKDCRRFAPAALGGGDEHDEKGMIFIFFVPKRATHFEINRSHQNRSKLHFADSRSISITS
jgi:hypothetical protein